MKLYDPPLLTGKYVQEVLASKWLTTGPMCERFIEAISERYSQPKAGIVLASSATAGFQAILDGVAEFGARGVAIGEATWPGMRSAVKHAGLTFEARHTAEVHVWTDIGGASTAEPPTHVDLRFDRPGRFRKPFVIHDACHSWLPSGGADFAVMSLYPTKLVPGAEGGVVFAAPDWAWSLRLRLNCGLTSAYGANVSRGLIPNLAGRKANMTDVQAALALEAFELAPAYMQDIREAWELLAKVAEENEVIYVPQPGRPYLFQIHVNRFQVRDMRSRLETMGIPSGWNFPPLGRVTLPCFPGLRPAEAVQIMTCVRTVLAEFEAKDDEDSDAVLEKEI